MIYSGDTPFWSETLEINNVNAFSEEKKPPSLQVIGDEDDADVIFIHMEVTVVIQSDTDDNLVSMFDDRYWRSPVRLVRMDQSSWENWTDYRESVMLQSSIDDLEGVLEVKVHTDFK